MKDSKDDNIEIMSGKIGTKTWPDGQKTNVYSIIGRPKEYESFDRLKNTTLEQVDNNLLTVNKEGEESKYYVCESFDIMYLSKNSPSFKHSMSSGDEEPLEGFIGKEMDLVQKDFYSMDDRIRDLPRNVTLGVDGLPFRYDLFGDDGAIFVHKEPSVRYAIGAISDIMKFPGGLDNPEVVDSLKEKDVETLKILHNFFKNKYRTPVFDEKVLEEDYPELYSKIMK